MRCFAPSLVAGMLCLACVPTRDLDEAASGSRQPGSVTGGSGATALPSESGQSGAGIRNTGGGTGTEGSGDPETPGRGRSAPSSAGASSGIGGTGHVGGATQGVVGTGATTGGSTALVGGAPSSSGDPAGTLGGTTPAGGGTGSGTGGSSAASGGRAASGGGAGEGGRSDAGGAFPTTGGESHVGGSSPGGAAGDGGTAGDGGLPTNVGGAELSAGGSSTAFGGATGEGGTTGNGGSVQAGTGSIAPDLPDLPIPPVSGGISYSEGASWDIEDVQVPAYEIHTPTANYWLVKSAAAIVEVTDNAGRKWISFSSGYRPKRGIPNLGGCCQPGDPAMLGMPEMETVVDAQSVTLTHLRLVSKPVDGDYYWLVWDFYLTHVTVTVNRAEEPFGFTYYGVPGGNLDPEDQLGLSTGETQSASVGLAEDLPGPVEWVYLTSPSPDANSALFLVQHDDDSLPESYGVADSNSAKFVFSSGNRTETPVRYSLGVVDSIGHAAVSERVGYVVESTPPLN